MVGNNSDQDGDRFEAPAIVAEKLAAGEPFICLRTSDG